MTWFSSSTARNKWSCRVAVIRVPQGGRRDRKTFQSPPRATGHSIHCIRLGSLMQVGMQHLVNGSRPISETDVSMSICLLARDGRTMPSASSTIAVVESQRRGDHRHGGRRSLKGESPFACISTSSIWYAWSITRLHARWFVTVVPCRQQAAHSPQRRGDRRDGERQSLSGGASFVCICVGGSRLLALFGEKTILASSS